MKDILKKRLKPSRYEHSLGVSDTAVFLAKRFGVDETKAKVAGLLHDCAREYANDELYSIEDLWSLIEKAKDRPE